MTDTEVPDGRTLALGLHEAEDSGWQREQAAIRSRRQARVAPVKEHATRCSAGWAFVLQHREAIDRAVRKQWSPFVDAEDFKQAAYLDIAEHAHQFNPERGEPAVFIYWRCRYTRLTNLRARRNANMRRNQWASFAPPRDENNGFRTLQDAETEVSAGWGSPESMERYAQVLQVLVYAEERGAMDIVDTVFRELEEKEVKAELGYTAQRRNQRLQKLGAQFRGEARGC